MSNHKEAFCLMWYACDKCRHRERIWNSRDGVTPFGTTCPSCGGIIRHADFQLDKPAPDHKLHSGQKFWRDGTPDEAEAIMRLRIEKMKVGPYALSGYSLSAEKIADLVRFAREGNEGEFQPGWPALDHYDRPALPTPEQTK